MRQHEDLAPVERLYARLADALLRGRTEPFAAPVTVAEIYQELVPYRIVRMEVGFDMNADYEHALLRMLAGEGECVRIEPAEVAQAIRDELRSPNPNLSVYREFAGCDVWVRRPSAVVPGLTRESRDDGAAKDKATAAPPDAASTFALAEDNGARTPAGGGKAEPAEAPEPWADTPAPTGPDRQDVRAAVAAPAEAASAASEPAAPAPAASAATEPAAPATAQPRTEPDAGAVPHCVFCDSVLPAQRQVRYCPFCGADQTKRPCGTCGEVLEPGWVFCIACGASTA